MAAATLTATWLRQLARPAPDLTHRFQRPSLASPRPAFAFLAPETHDCSPGEGVVVFAQVEHRGDTASAATLVQRVVQLAELRRRRMSVCQGRA